MTHSTDFSQNNAIGVRVKYLHTAWEGQELETATSGSAGVDLRACIDQETLTIEPGDRAPIPAGLAIEITAPGFAGFIFSRSGLGAKDGLTVSQGVGVIDPDYRGEIIVSLLNTSKERRTIRRGQRIAQLIFLPFAAAHFTAVEELTTTERGAGGFGHTGKK
ncbi:MAG: dUTP diphosphatase [Desulfovibrio sp.]|uniref:dUTP diphosphatase n=1 Tax=Desulfovibrio sp. 7SRBS1 TaxID=3378064 RepID=UPI003B3EBCC8